MKLKSFLYPVALLPILALAACGDSPDDTVSVQSQPDGSATVQVQVPESMAGAAEALANPEQSLETLRQNAAGMTEEAKLQAVQAARRAAEEAARFLGQTEEQIRRAGDDAETNSREAMGI